ncbi:MAG: hypothetical protein HOD92_22625 [Deltaproteobacteria bacterium]|jgi:hypothetical protein|nr:hypothetical protein [Deltaproteobacteria bacterium]MBT4526666.1 hypothetical protein [Deltaproteobacteria bacterium]
MDSQVVTALLTKAKLGNPVFITDVRQSFERLKSANRQKLFFILDLPGKDTKRLFKIYIPTVTYLNNEQLEFVRSYIQAEIYNILSTLGGLNMVIYLDTTKKDLIQFVKSLNNAFELEKPRSARLGYGRAVNVIERIRSSLEPENYPKTRDKFTFNIEDISLLPELTEPKNDRQNTIGGFENAAKNLTGKVICGVDIGGTNNKVVLVNNGTICCVKEYSWFPAKFKIPAEQINPIYLLIKLVIVKVSLDENNTLATEKKTKLLKDLDSALKREATYAYIKEVVEEAESALNGNLIEVDAIGVSFPDVVIKDKIVGGEVSKMRGMRENPDINYEQEFISITNLDEHLKELCKKEGIVKIINDGSMAAFTAAVELSSGKNSAEIVKNGIFAHTLGTELGTGWVTPNGIIPEIPLEVYSIIIDLGSFIEREYHCDDLRSINNFNTNLPGTLQKYTSQSGVFRLALKYFPKERPDLYQELFDMGFIEEKTVNGTSMFIVPTEPVDMRKGFMGHMMQLLDREDNETTRKIFSEIGYFLAITWLETERLLKPEANSRQLFGGLLTNKKCYQQIQDGAQSLIKDLHFDIANEKMANTALMKQLENHPDYSVGQFALTIGAVYYANQGL